MFLIKRLSPAPGGGYVVHYLGWGDWIPAYMGQGGAKYMALFECGDIMRGLVAAAPHGVRYERVPVMMG